MGPADPLGGGRRRRRARGVDRLSFVTYAYVRSYLITQRDRVTVRQTFANARVVRDVLLETSPSVNQLLSGLQAPSRAATCC